MTSTYDPTLYATDRRAIVFVDAAFVLHVMQAHHQVSALSELAIDHPRLIDQLRRRAEEVLGCPVLRVYWYDAEHPSGRVPNLVASAMGRVDGVRVRLGTLHVRPDGRLEQKAVDTLLVRDMIAHAYKKTVSEMILVSGDNDLAPGVEEAQEQGVRVHLWSIAGEDLPPSVGRGLANLADSRLELGAVDLAQSVRASSPPVRAVAEPAATSADQPAETAPEVAPVEAGPPAPGPTPIPQPVPFPHPASPPHVPAKPWSPAGGKPTSAPSSTTPTPRPPISAPAAAPAAPAPLAAQTPQVYSTDRDAFPTLYDLNKDTYNAPVNSSGAAAVGMAYAERWAEVVARADLERLYSRHDPSFAGNIPKPVDADLLFFGQDHGLDTYAVYLKFDLRRGFWNGIAAAIASTGSSAPERSM